MYKGQKVVFSDERDQFFPFKAVVLNSGARALEDIRWKKSGASAAGAGYVMYKGATPDLLVHESKIHGWNCKPLIEMEENE